MKPLYTSQELKAIDKIVEKEKTKARIAKAGKEFATHIKSFKK